MTFRLVPGTQEADFLAADRAVQEDFAYHQPGLVRRTTARGENGDWIVLDLWRSSADSDACAVRWDADPVARRFMDFIDRSTLRSSRWFPLD